MTWNLVVIVVFSISAVGTVGIISTFGCLMSIHFVPGIIYIVSGLIAVGAYACALYGAWRTWDAAPFGTSRMLLLSGQCSLLTI